jgi:predicted ribosome quality control (RQC) complex YloA/Tae2 family protein
MTTTIFDINANKHLIYHIGKNAKDNWTIFDNALPSDYWFHLDEYPSCHIIVETDTDIHIDTIKYCAKLCKLHSKKHNDKNIGVIYTQIKNIKKSKQIGSVIAKNTKIIFI